MLKKRSKAVSSKQGVVSHSTSLASLTANLTHRPSSSSLFPSLSPLLSLSPKQFSGSETSVKCSNFMLDFKLFYSTCNPFFSDKKIATCVDRSSGIKHHPWDGRDCEPVGLAIVDAFSSEKPEHKSSMSENKLVRSGSLIKVQAPSTSQLSFQAQRTESRHCPVEFGVKNKESQLAMALLFPGSSIPTMDDSPRALCLSASEMELSEDYTCVISHGPQQKKTHIFDNIIIESCGNGLSSLGKITLPSDQFGSCTSDHFLSFCHACRNTFVQENDLFFYRGEKVFCSQECRNREIIYQEGRDHS